MAFVKKTWVDRLVEYAGRRKITNVSTQESQIVDVEREEGVVSQEGSAFSAATMNDLEQRISDEFGLLNKNIQNVRTYVSDDGKLHFVDSEGADSVLPFNKALDPWVVEYPKNSSAAASVQITLTFPSRYKYCDMSLGWYDTGYVYGVKEDGTKVTIVQPTGGDVIKTNVDVSQYVALDFQYRVNIGHTFTFHNS